MREALREGWDVRTTGIAGALAVAPGLLRRIYLLWKRYLPVIARLRATTSSVLAHRKGSGSRAS